MPVPLAWDGLELVDQRAMVQNRRVWIETADSVYLTASAAPTDVAFVDKWKSKSTINNPIGRVWREAGLVACSRLSDSGEVFTSEDVWAALGVRRYVLVGRDVCATLLSGLVAPWDTWTDDPGAKVRPRSELGSTSGLGAVLNEDWLKYEGEAIANDRAAHVKHIRSWRGLV